MQEFITYIDEAVQNLEKEEQMLVNSERKDESNLVKIRINIYGICKTVLNVVAKGGNPAWKDAYLQKLTVLSGNWRTSYEKAKEHNDVEKLVIEEIKLETMKEIMKKCEEICGEAYGKTCAE